MQNLCNKAISVLVLSILLICNCMTTIVCGAELIEQNIATSEDNVTFNATIGNGESHSGYEYVADINSNDTALYVSIEVKNAGYLKDSIISLEGNNYKIDVSKVQNEQIKNITESTIELNQINTGENVNLVLPIYLEKNHKIAQDELSRESKVKLTSTYVNQSNKQKKIEKQLLQHLRWTTSEEELSSATNQKVIRYLNYDGKTMVSLLLSDVLNEYKLPINSKQLLVSVPKVRDMFPSKVIVTSVYTANTNGKLDGVDFGEDDFSYDKEKGIVIINVQNNVDSEGNIAWHKGLEDKFVITYIYNVNTNEESLTINSKVVSKTTLVNNMTVSSESEQNEYVLDSKIGDIATAEVSSNETTLNKGYMYSNKDKSEGKLETEFTLNYRLNIGLAEALQNVQVKEIGNYFNEEDVSQHIYNKKVRVSKQELVKILGEQGTIKVLNADGKVLGTINKDTLEVQVNESKLIFETSKPQIEGELNIVVNKAIKSEMPYTKEQIANFKTLTSKVQINEVAQNVINLEEPTSKATLDINNTNLSTVVTNKDVIMTATLETNDITDNLYKNPEIYIKLPDEVKQINVKDAQLLYEDELVSKSSTIEGNTIKVSLEGTQSKYSSGATANGSVIRIVADLTLDNLAPSSTEDVILGYTNDNDISRDVKEVALPVNVVAPTGFVTTNTMSGFNGDETVSSQEGRENIGKLPTLANKEVTVSGVAVNNLGQDVEGLRLLGRIPFRGNKQVDGSSDLGTTIDTTLISEVAASGIEAKIYYSANPEATTELASDHEDDEENYEDTNQWVSYYISNAKSFMIVANGAVQDQATINFSYKVKTGYVEYGNVMKATYGVYYSNGAEEGTKHNVVLATPVGLRTSEIPQMSINISAKDMFTNAEIADNGNVKEGQYLTYNLNVTNTSHEDALNTKAVVELPAGLNILNIIDNDFGMYKEYVTSMTNPYEIDLGTIKAGETKNFTLNLIVTSNVSSEDPTKTLRVSAKADEMPDAVVQLFNTKLVEGYVNGVLKATYEDKTVNKDQEINYALTINNVNNKSKTNVVAKIILPEGVDYIDTIPDEYSGDTQIPFKGNYNSQTREVTFNIGTLEANNWKTVHIKTKVNGNKEGQLKAKANISCSETADIFQTNETTLYYGTPNVNARLSSNIDGRLLDTDTLEYYIDFTNNSDIPTEVNVREEVPEELAVKSYKLEVAGNVVTDMSDYSGSRLSEQIELGGKQTARLTVVTKPHILPSAQTKKITNSPKAYFIENNEPNEDKEIAINTLSHTVEGTGDTVVTNGLYRISGIAWLDSNKDGRKDVNETRLSNIKITLYTQSGSIAKDENGNDRVVTTDSNGKYNFDNLNQGNYLVVAEYDNNNYIVTTYKVNGVIEAENSDFFDTKLGDKSVAATDIITIANSNVYNIDLGLKEKEQFDLSLDKVVNKVTVTNTKLDPRVYEFNKKFVQVSLYNTYVEYSTVLIEYDISVKNNGKVPGYAKEIVDYIPEGMAFSSELNNNWYVGRDGNAYTTALANTIINPGETKSVKLVLTRKMTGENVGLVHNVAEISKDYNEQGLKDGNSTPANKKDGEDDMSSADVLLSMGTGKEVASFIGITAGVLAIVALAVYLIKKYIIVKI